MKLFATLLLLTVLMGCADMSRFKFQTSGQNLDVVPIYSFTVEGLVLKPATPSDAKIFRDAQNNALIQWRRRGRINHHWRDRAGVPVSEEREYYEIEALSGSTVVHTYRVPINQAQPIQWQQVIGDLSYLHFATDGSGTVYRNQNFADDPNAAVAIASKQLIDGDFAFEFQVYNNGSQNYLISDPLINTALDAASGDSLASLTATLNNVAVSTPSGSVTTSAIAGDRFVLFYSQGVMSYYKNPISDNSPTFARASVTQGHAPYWIRCSFGVFNNWGIRNPSLLRFVTPDWTYTANMQTADGLTPGAPIHLKIYQVSAQVGRGDPLEVTL